MSVYIVDASVVIDYLVAGAFTRNSRAFFEQVTPNDRLLVPEFCLLECANVLWKHVRFQGMSVPQGRALLKHLKKMPLSRVPAKAALDAALDIGLTYQLAVYDAAYVALANRSHYPLITIDQAQSRAAAAEGVTLIPIINFQP